MRRCAKVLKQIMACYLGCSVAWFKVECFNQLLKPISSYVGPDTNYYLQTFYPLIPIIKWSIANVGSDQRRNISLFLLEIKTINEVSPVNSENIKDL